MRLWNLALAPLLLAAALTNPLSAAAPQGDPADPNPASLGWTGAFEIAGKTKDTLSAQDVADLRRRVAELRVLARAGRLPDAQVAALDRIWAYACATGGFEGQDELLAEVALARSEQHEAAGRMDAALYAAVYLLMRDDQAFAKERAASFIAAPSALLALEQEVVNVEQLRTRRRWLESVGGHNIAQQSTEDLDASVQAHIESGNFQLVVEIGARSVPALEQAVLGDLNDFPSSVGEDPLYYLIRLGERRAAKLVLSNIDRGGYLWHLRIVRALEQASVLETPDSWGTQVGDAPTPARVPEWPRVVARLLGDPDSAREAMALVREVFRADGVTPELAEALRAALESDVPDLVSDAMHLLRTDWLSRKSPKPLYEALMQHENPELRVLASERLLAYPHSAALLSRAEDPDSRVRRNVAKALRRRKVSGSSAHIVPVLDDAALAATTRLVDDEVAAIRRSAAWAAVDMSPRLPAELYARIGADPDPSVRSRLTWFTHPDQQFLTELMTGAATDPDASVRTALDERLGYDETWKNPGPFLEAARIRLVDRDVVMEPRDRKDMIAYLAPFDDGVRTLVQAALEYPDGSLLREIWEWRNYLSSSTGSKEAALLILDDESLADMYVLLHANSAGGSNYLNMVLGDANAPRWAAMLRVLADDSAPVDARLKAATLACHGGGQAFSDALLDFLAAPEWKARAMSPDEADVLRNNVLYDLPDGERNPMLLAMVRQPGIRASIIDSALGIYIPEGPTGRELTLEVIQRWKGMEAAQYEPLNDALFHLRTLPEDADPEVLARAARTAKHALTAVGTIGALRDPVYLPVLEECLRADWVRVEAQRLAVQKAAIQALSGYLTEASAEVLLRGMGTASDRFVRDLCRSALANIRSYEEERRLWAEHKEGRGSSGDAVERLLGLLRDPSAEVRAEAARALGTLGALETLPELIEMLRDETPEVRAAAKSALDRLNSATARPANEPADEQTEG
ncbi:MAG: HEAT repeat domain-containing protein [Planctomycetota bacterium]